MYTSNHITTDSCRKDFIGVFGDRYDYSKIEYVHAKHKMEIICLEHGSFFMNRNDHLNGHGCPKYGKKSRNQKVCAIEKTIIGSSGKTLFEERYSKIYAKRLQNDPETYKNAGFKTVETKRKTYTADGKTQLEISLEKALQTKEKWVYVGLGIFYQNGNNIKLMCGKKQKNH